MKCIGMLNDILMDNPENDKALYRKGRVLIIQKEYGKAKETLEELIKVCKKKRLIIPKDVPNLIKQCNDAINAVYKSMCKYMFSN